MTTSLKSTSYHSYSSTDMEGPNDPGQVVTPPASLTSSGIAPAHQFLYLNVTLRAFNVDFLNFSILGFRSCVPLVADRSNTLNSVWQEPSRLWLTGVSDLTAVATLQEFPHGISMGSVLFCLFAVFNLSLFYQYL